jgi:PAS domain S-box-containing protein
MKIQSKILVSIAASFAVAAMIALIAFSILKGMNTELARIRVYDQIIRKTHALDILAGYLKEGSGQSDIRQVRGTLGSLDDLLSKMTSRAPREENLIRQLQGNNSELSPLIDQMFVTGQGVDDGIERERRNVLASQILMKVKFISEDTDLLKDISDSMIISAQEKAGATVIALIIILALTNGIIYFLSGRSIMHGQEALRESEERFRVTLGSIGDAVIATDASGLVTFLNPIAAKLTGWESGAASDQPIQDVFRIINEQTRQPARNVVERVLREGNIVNLANHTALVTRDGREIPIEDSAAPIRDKEGAVLGVVLVFHDVTEKRLAQEALRESQQKNEFLANIIEMASQPFAVGYPDGSLGLINNAFEHLTGYSSDELQSIDWATVLTPQEWQPIELLKLDELHRTGKAVRYEKEYIRKDGSRVPIELLVHLVTESDGKPQYYYSFLTEITERKLAEERLRASEQEFVAVFERAAVGKVLTDPATNRMLRVNKALADMLGYSIDELSQMTFVEITHPEDREQGLTGYDLVRKGSTDKWQVEKRCVRKDGSIIWVNSSGSMIHYEDGRPDRSIAVIQDITERKQAEEKLRTTLQRFNNILSNVLYGILLVGEDDRVEFANQYFCDQFGFAERPSDMVGMTAREMLQKVSPAYADPEINLARIGQIVAQGNRVRDEEISMHDGRVLLRDFVPISVDGKPSGRMWHHRDISERKRMEEELHKAKEEAERHAKELEALMDAVPALIWVTRDTECLSMSGNRAVYELLGMPIGANVSKAAPETERPVHFRALRNGIEIPPDELPMQRAAKGEGMRDYELEYAFDDGTSKITLGNTTPLYDASGHVYGAIAAFVDITERKRAEVLLQRQAGLLHLSYDAIIVWRLGGRIESWNKGAGELYGYSEKEAVGLVTHDLLKTIHHEPWAQIEAKLRERKFWEGELKHSTRDGREVIVSARLQLVRGADGEERVLEINRDITERKQAEAALRESQSRLAAELAAIRRLHQIGTRFIRNGELGKVLQEVVDAAVAITGSDMGNMQLLDNSGELKIVAHRGFEQPFLDFFDSVHEGQASCGTALKQRQRLIVEDIAESAVFAGSPAREVVLASGARAVQSTPLFNRSGHLLGMLSTHYKTRRRPGERDLLFIDMLSQQIGDILERMRTEEGLRKSRDELELRVQERTAELVSANEAFRASEQRFRRFYESPLLGVIFWNMDGMITDANDKFLQMVGYGREDLTAGRIDWINMTPPEFRHLDQASVIELKATGVNNEPFEKEYIRKDGSRLPIIVASAMLDEPRLNGVAFVLDISAKKLAEEALRSNMARLELVNAELQEFAFVASHDLQEPLRKIQTFCDMAQKRCAPVLDATSKDYLDRIVNSASRMRQLLTDLLQFSRVATRPEPFKKLDLVKIVREAADVFEASVKETGCRIEIENIPAIEADESQMSRLFQNLIGNALKFRGGDTPHITVYGKLDGRRICEIFVKDNGIGFDPQFAEIIFKPFQRLHGRSEYDGTGMGLAICRKIVERHGGNIRAESEPGAGSTFIIRLPVKQDRWDGV